MPPLVWVPGLLCTASVFDDLARRLGGTVCDLPAANDWGRIAESVLSRLPDRCILAGLSMGGYLGFEIHRRAPGRIAAMVLIDSSARPDPEEAKARRAKLSVLGRDSGIDAVAEALIPALLGAASHADARLTGLVRAMARDVGAQTFAAHQEALMQRPDSRPDLPGITVPVLAITGADDAITPPRLGREIADLVPRGTHVEIPDAGHLTPIEAPEAVAEAISPFLARLAA